MGVKLESLTIDGNKNTVVDVTVDGHAARVERGTPFLSLYGKRYLLTWIETFPVSFGGWKEITEDAPASHHKVQRTTEGVISAIGLVSQQIADLDGQDGKDRNFLIDQLRSVVAQLREIDRRTQLAEGELDRQALLTRRGS